MATIVIPAHDEAAVVSRLLTALLDGSHHEIEVVVVANGCRDRTADVARSHPGVRVVETPEPSKQQALRLGDDVATGFPRIYIDADVVLDGAAARALVRWLSESAILAVAPQRRLPRDGVSLLVRSYYDVWERLPQVQTSLFGRGVVALSEEGWRRVRALPPVMSDDLAISEAFEPHERLVVSDAIVTVYPPRRLRDLVRRRVRVATGTVQSERLGTSGAQVRTSLTDLAGIVRAEPAIALRMPVFLGVTLAARLLARRRVRRGDFQTWLRDGSSRHPV